jgi:hypothetical protein
LGDDHDPDEEDPADCRRYREYPALLPGAPL